MQRTIGGVLSLAAGCGAIRMMDSVEDLVDLSGESVATSKWSLAPSLAGKGHPGLCDEALVLAGCHTMELGQSDDTHTSVNELMMSLSATHASTLKFLAEIGIKAGSDQQEVIDCMDLCQKTMKSIGEHYLPPVSDVACRPDREKGGALCDIDVSPGLLQAVKFDENAPDFHAGHPVEHDEAPDYESGAKGSLASITSVEDTLDDVDPKESKVRILNVFRMYPLLDIGARGKDPDPKMSALLQAESAKAKANLTSKGCQPDICTSTRYCTLSITCGDCSFCSGSGSGGNSPYGSGGSSYPYGGGGGGSSYPYGGGGGGSSYPYGGGGGGSSYPYGGGGGGSSYPYGGGGGGSSYPYGGGGGDPYGQYSDPNELSASQLSAIDVISRKAQAYVAHALSKRADSRMLRLWFGEDTQLVRSKVSKVLNSLSGMLSNVEYRKGPECESNTYAYVYPRGPKTKNEHGQFIFFLCDYYLNTNEGEQIETLTHEGSHHATSYTKDVCSGHKDSRGKCITAYGRPTCKTLANEYPDRAQDNADSFCYYINDVNTDPPRR